MKIMKTKKRIALIVFASVLLSSTPSYATPLDENNELATLTSIEQLEIRIQQLDNQIIESLAKVENLNQEIAIGKRKIEQATEELTIAEQDYEAYKQIFSKRLQSYQIQGSNPSMTYTEILFSSKNISDFFNRTFLVAQIFKTDKDLLEEMKEKETELQQKKEKLDNELALLEKNKEALAIEKESIERDKQEVKTELSQERENLREQQSRLFSLPSTSINIPFNDPSKLSYSLTNAKTVISQAEKYLGVPYLWGGTSPNGFDCSGLTQYVYRSVGVSLPRVARDQQNYGTMISPNQVQPGDLVFKGYPAYHVGIYIGGGKWLHAPQTGDVVKIASYDPTAFTSASRVLN